MGGKDEHEESAGLNVDQQSHPGCMWSIFHVLKYHRWRYVRKKLPHKRSKNEISVNDSVSHPPDASKSVEHKSAEPERTVEKKPSKSVKARIKALVTSKHKESSGNDSLPPIASKGAERKDTKTGNAADEKPSKSTRYKNSVKARIKALITDDKQKKNGKHHRTVSVPQLNHHKEPVPGLIFPKVTNTSEAKDRNRKTGNDNAVEQKLDIAKQTLAIDEELETDPSAAAESKESMDALNIINLNKESLMKLLQIQNADSLPMADPSRGGEFELLKFRSMRETLPKASEYKNDGLLRSRSTMSRNADLLKNSGECQPLSSVSRFKNLKNKIKNVLDESRDEKQRIAMDAVLHKVPPGDKFSKETKREVSELLKNGRDGRDSPQAIKSPKMRRASSLRESVSRYCQLYEATSKESEKEAQDRHKSSPPKTGKKALARIHSLPDLNHFEYRNEDSSEAFSVSMRTAADRFGEEKGDSEESKGQDDSIVAVEVNSVTSVASNDQNGEKGLYIDGTSQIEDGIVAGKSSPKLEESSEVSELDVGFEDDDENSAKALEPLHFPPKEPESSPGSHESNIDAPETIGAVKSEIPTRNLVDIPIPRLRVEENIKAEFQYVQDILTLSGFSGTEALGEWHADDQPLDPSMYDEVEGYLVLEPACSGNEGANYIQLALFDVVNEMLMEIYGRSCTYVPRRLSPLCHIRLLPKGRHVLEEVWEEIRWFLNFWPEAEQPADYVVARDLAKSDGWMSLQHDSECVGLELESLIFDDLLDEAIWE